MLRVVFLLAGIAVFVYLLVSLGPSAIVSLLVRIGWNFALVCTIYGAYIMVRARALFECVLDRTGISYWQVLLIYLSGESAKNLTFGGALFSEPVKAVLIGKKGLPRERAVAAVLTEFLASLVISSCLSLIGLVLLSGHALQEPLATATRISILGISVFLSALILAGVFRVRPMSGLLRMIDVLPGLPVRVRPHLDGARKVEDLLYLILRGRSVRTRNLLGLELLAQVVIVFELYWILRASGHSFPVLSSFLIESAAKLVRVVFFFVPLQIGATEGVFALLAESLGFTAAVGFTLSFVRRLRSIVIAGLGLLAGWYTTRRPS